VPIQLLQVVGGPAENGLLLILITSSTREIIMEKREEDNELI